MDNVARKVIFSRKKDEWSTPLYLFEYISKLWGPFDLDPCGMVGEQKLCSTVYTIEDDGLKQPWINKTIFINPPYSKTKAWIGKALQSLKQNKRIVFLIPARTDTKLFHELIVPKAKNIFFIKGRIKFGGSNNCAPFPSMIVVFENNTLIDLNSQMQTIQIPK